MTETEKQTDKIAEAIRLIPTLPIGSDDLAARTIDQLAQHARSMDFSLRGPWLVELGVCARIVQGKGDLIMAHEHLSVCAMRLDVLLEVSKRVPQ